MILIICNLIVFSVKIELIVIGIPLVRGQYLQNEGSLISKLTIKVAWVSFISITISTIT